MIRSTPLKRTAWPRRLPPTGEPARRLEQNQPLAPVKYAPVAMKKIVVVGAKMARISDLPHTAITKAPDHRNPALLEMARGRPCLLAVPGVCRGGTESTVSAHSNWAHHGKGMARKASDAYTVWACAACHIGWLDQGPAPKATKMATFMRAHADQVLAWRLIAQDTSEKPRFRKAAQWALDLLNASPNPSTTV